MNNMISPTLRTYPIGDNSMGVVAEFSTDASEYLKVERLGIGLGINWTTNLGSGDIPATVQAVLPRVAEVEVWHPSGIDKLAGDNTEEVLRTIASQDTIRLTFSIEPGLVSKNGLLINWRIRHEGIRPPYQIGVLATIDDLTATRSLIESTATPNIVSSSKLLDKLLEQI